MSTVEAFRSGAGLRSQQLSWTKMQHGEAYQCRVLLCAEPDGGYSATAVQLPGVVSEGDTIEEAIANVAEAFRAVIKAYTADGLDIPWEIDATFECPSNSIEKWIVVNV